MSRERFDDTAPALSIKDAAVTAATGDGEMRILESLSLELNAGECFIVVGDAGSGKSMLARVLLGCAGPGVEVQGQIALAGLPVASLSPARWRNLRGAAAASLCGDAAALFDPLEPAGPQLVRVLRAAGLGAGEAKSRLQETMRAAELRDPARFWRLYPGEMTPLHKARARLALIMALRPRLIVADEPLSGLDAEAQLAVAGLLRELPRTLNAALLVLTREPTLAAAFPGRAALLAAGRFVAIGPAADILRHPRAPAGSRTLLRLPDLKDEAARAARSPRNVLLQVKDLRTPVAPDAAGLEDVSFDVRGGTCLAVVGERGSGRDSLVPALLGLAPGARGRVLFESVDLARLSPHLLRARLKRIGVLQREGGFDPRRDIAANLVATLREQAGLTATQAKDRVTAIARRMGLDDGRLAQRPGALPLSDLRRAELARVLTAEPDVLILDDPTAGLPPSDRAGFVALLKETQARGGFGVLLVTGDLTVAAELADDLLVLRDGKVVERGPALRVLADPQNAYTDRLVKAAAMFGAVR